VNGTDEEADASKPGVTPHVEPAFVTGNPLDPYGLLDQALAERRALVELCLYALDRARSSGVAERIEQGLHAAGVSAVRPNGQRFDPAAHEAGGTVPTPDAALDGLVAETEVVGFADRGRVLRAPVVIVYQKQGG
jgi:molecular chaperone GrpE